MQVFNQIIVSLTLILKISRSTESATQPGENRVGVNSNSKVECDSRYKVGNGEVDSIEVEVNRIDNNDQKISKSKK